MVNRENECANWRFSHPRNALGALRRFAPRETGSFAWSISMSLYPAYGWQEIREAGHLCQRSGRYSLSIKCRVADNPLDVE